MGDPRTGRARLSAPLFPFIAQRVNLVCKFCQILVGSALAALDNLHQAFARSYKASKHAGRHDSGCNGLRLHSLALDAGIKHCIADKVKAGHIIGRAHRDIVAPGDNACKFFADA